MPAAITVAMDLAPRVQRPGVGLGGDSRRITGGFNRPLRSWRSWWRSLAGNSCFCWLRLLWAVQGLRWVNFTVGTCWGRCSSQSLLELLCVLVKVTRQAGTGNELVPLPLLSLFKAFSERNLAAFFRAPGAERH